MEELEIQKLLLADKLSKRRIYYSAEKTDFLFCYYSIIVRRIYKEKIPLFPMKFYNKTFQCRKNRNVTQLMLFV